MLKNLLTLLIVTAVCIPASFADEKKSQSTPVKAKQSQEAAAAPANDSTAPDTRTNLEKLSDPDPVIRRNALIYLGAEKNKENFSAISKMLEDPDTEVRRSAVNALAAPGDARAASALIDRFNAEGNINVRINIVTALGELRSRTAVDVLKSLLKDSYPAFRNEAVRALGKINAPETYPQIVSMLGDEAEGVRVMASETVAKLKIYSAAPELRKNLENPVGVVRRSAAEALGVVGDSNAVHELEKLLKDTDQSVSKAAKNAIEKIKQRASSETKSVQQPKPQQNQPREQER